MPHGARRFIWMVGVLGILWVAWAVAPAGQPTRERTGVPAVALADGAALYRGYCAPCHGEHAKGDGPLADFLSRPPIDLTTIALVHDGTFPVLWVEDFIANRGRSIARGRDQMPNWGLILRSRSPSQAVYQLKLRNLVNHIRSIQVKQ